MNISKTIVLATLLSISLTSCKDTANQPTKDVSVAKNKKAPAKNPATATFHIEGMTCAIGCAKTIESKLTVTDGVSEATVDFETKIATVKFDKTKQSIESLTKTVEKVGGGDLYKVTKSEKSTDKA